MLKIKNSSIDIKINLNKIKQNKRKIYSFSNNNNNYLTYLKSIKSDKCNTEDITKPKNNYKKYLLKGKNVITGIKYLDNYKKRNKYIIKTEDNKANKYNEIDLELTKYISRNLYNTIKKQKSYNNNSNKLKYLFINIIRKLARIKASIKNGNLYNIKLARRPLEDKEFYNIIDLIKNDRYNLFKKNIKFRFLHGFDIFKKTLLHYAVIANNLYVVMDLIAKGIDYEAADIFGRNAIYFSVINQNYKILSVILQVLIIHRSQPMVKLKIFIQDRVPKIPKNTQRKYKPL